MARYTVTLAFRDRRSGVWLPTGCPFFADGRYADALEAAGCIMPSPIITKEGTVADVQPTAAPIFRDDAAKMGRADSGDTCERTKPGKRKPGRPARAAGHSDQR